MKAVQKLLPIYLVIFFGFIGYSLIITIFPPLFLSQGDGLLPADTSQRFRLLALGFLIFLYPFGQFLSSPILGALSDRFGRRPILLISLAITTIVYALIGVGVWLKELWMIALFLLIAGLSEGNVTIAQSTVADLVPKNERARLFGYISFAVSLSYIAGPLLGGWLTEPSIFSQFAYAIPFFAVSALLFGNLLWLYWGFKEPMLAHNKVYISYLEAFTNLKNLFFMRRVRFLFFVNFLLYFSLFGFFQSFPIYIVSQFKVDVWTLSLFIAWSSVPFLIVNLWLTGALAKIMSPWLILILASIWTGIFLEILLIPAQKEALWITLFLVGFGAAFCIPSMLTLLSSHTANTELGRVLGINQSLQFFAEAISGLAMGLLAAIFIKLALIIFGIFSFLAAFLLATRKDFS